MPSNEMRELFDRLRRIVEPFDAQLHVRTDDPGHHYLESTAGPKPEMFSAIMEKKDRVSFHYYPVYLEPSLVDGMSPELKRRMAGKSCFNFKRVDDPAIDDLAALVQASAPAFLGRRTR